jgi:hypothetical protein
MDTNPPRPEDRGGFRLDYCLAIGSVLAFPVRPT